MHRLPYVNKRMGAKIIIRLPIVINRIKNANTPDPIPNVYICKTQEKIKKMLPTILVVSIFSFIQSSIPKIFCTGIRLVVQYQK